MFMSFVGHDSAPDLDGMSSGIADGALSWAILTGTGKGVLDRWIGDGRLVNC